MSEIISRDNNHRTIGAGVSNDVDKSIIMLRVDPVSKYLLVDITSTGSSSANAVQIAKRDGNHRTVCLGWDDTNKILQEILTDSSGRLLCDLIFT